MADIHLLHRLGHIPAQEGGGQAREVLLPVADEAAAAPPPGPGQGVPLPQAVRRRPGALGPGVDEAHLRSHIGPDDLLQQGPAFTRYTYPAAEHKFATVGRIFEPSLERESDAVAAERSCDAIDCFLKRIGLWINFRELNVTKEDIREIADCGQVLGDYANNPRVATIPEMYELLMSCYDRK